MPHKLISIRDLAIQPGYNDLVRSAKEVAANAKDVEKAMEAQGDAKELFPIRFVTIGKNKFTRNHATLIAAQSRGWDEIYAVQSPHEPGSTADLLDLIFSNNSGHPLSRVAQGKLYKALRDGEVDEEATAKAQKIANVGDEVETVWKRQPMTEKEIGDACKPAYTSEHVRQCILLAESSPDVGELIESGQVALNIVIAAKSLAKDDDAKQLRILKKAIANAKEDDKAKATQKHFDAIKAEFIAPKKLKAAPLNGKEESSSEQEGTQEPSGSEKKGETAKLPVVEEQEASEAPEQTLFPQAEQVLTEGSKKNAKLIKALSTLFADTEGLGKLNIDISLTVEECDLLAEEVVKIVANAAVVF